MAVSGAIQTLTGFLRALTGTLRPVRHAVFISAAALAMLLPFTATAMIMAPQPPEIYYYSYQSGNWNDPATWTTDPSGTLSENPAVPDSDDRVVILNGRTVTVTGNNLQTNSLQINEGGTVDLGATTGHDFGLVRGQGVLRLSTNNFPGGNFSEFVSAGGGTIEYYEFTSNQNFTQLTYNNLQINLSDPATRIRATGNMTINGNLTVESGTFQVNNDTGGAARNITVEGSVVVGNNGRIGLGAGIFRHNFTIRGDFTIDGDVRFTDRNAPNYLADDGARVHVIFDNPAADQHVMINAPAIFYRIQVDKGTDDTYILHLDATDDNFFRLYGPNNLTPNTPLFYPDGSIRNENALGLEKGTLRLGENIIVPALASSVNYTQWLTGEFDGRNYAIDEAATLWIDGATVFTSAFLPDGPNSQNAKSIMSVYGKLRISAGQLTDNAWQGIGLRQTGQMIVEGGEVSSTIIRTSAQAANHRGAYIQTGGTVTIRRDYITFDGFSASFHLGYSTTSFSMSGGELTILRSTPTEATTTQGRQFSFVLASASENIQVTGGTINIHIPAGRNAFFTSRGDFHNLNIIKEAPSAFQSEIRNHLGRAGVSEAVAALPLKVQNNFSISQQGIFSTGTANVDVTVGGNFTVEPQATYTPGNNTTVFDGQGPRQFTASGTITTGLNNMSLEGQADLTLAGAATLTVRGNLRTGAGTTLRDNGRTISVAGNLVKDGIHFKPAAGAGRIQLTGNAAQTISGGETGIINNLTVNKTGGTVTMTSGITLTGNLRLTTNHRLDIGSNMLKLGPESNVYSAVTGTDQNFSANRMIVGGGLASDGGIKKRFGSTGEFLFPSGFRAANNNFYYMPAYIDFTQSPDTWGSVTIRPVGSRHPLAQGSGNCLTTWWKTTSEGFSDIILGSMTQRYFYDQAVSDYFVEGNEPAYIPAVYRGGTEWTTIPDINLVNQGINEITFPGQTVIAGEYTAGEPPAFVSVPILFSRGDGDWDDSETWSETTVGGGAGTMTPGPGTIVVIGDGTHNHTVTITADGRESGALSIAPGSVLDLGSTQGHDFSAIAGETAGGSGRLRISRTGYFPRGDFGEFLGPSGGTTEYYTSGSDINIPFLADGGMPLNQYRNLVLNHPGNIISLPDTDLTIHEDLILEGTTASSRTSTGSTWTTLTVNGNIEARSGTFIIMEGTPSKTLRVMGDLTVNPGAVFRVRTSEANTNHTIELHGNLHNDGTFNMHQTNSRVAAIFRGTANTTISGAGATYNFFNITIDKGTDRTPVVSLESNITTGVINPFLTLQNGTFRIDNSGLTVTLTNGTTPFTIPATAALSVNAGEVRVAYGASGSADLLLAGTLEVLGGTMYIGNPDVNTNNSIEYASAGLPEIVVAGGELFVNGKIRRSTEIAAGSLSLIQSGGEVTIMGKARSPARAMLEITNPGSRLEMSGGAIMFGRPSAEGGATFGDIYLRPDTYDITGGTLQGGVEEAQAPYNFRLSTSAPLWNLAVGSTLSDHSLTTEVLPPTILNDLVIRGDSWFDAGALDLHIEGSLFNNNPGDQPGISEGGFRAGSLTQTTTFSGSDNQQIAGSGTNLTNFANLAIASGGTVTLQDNTTLSVNRNLDILSGVLDDGENDINVAGNVINTATHTGPSPSGGIRLAGSLNQRLSGIGGVFGNIMLDNATGVTLLDNMTINGRLTFEEGSMYIDDYMITFGTDASVGGTPGTGSMIILNGALSDQGVRKLFPAGASQFTMPIGVPGKYTPASYNITANTAPGSITVRPVNRRHPAVVEPGELTELAYYWAVDSTGFGMPFTLSHTYHYLEEDVRPAADSDAGYVAALYRTYNYYWTDLGDEGEPGLVDEDARTVNINDVSYIAGDFTAGQSENFTPPLDIYYSRNDRPGDDWTDPETWSTTNHDGPPASDPPFGNPMIIAEEHSIDIDQDGQYSVSVEVNGTLNIGTTVFHNLGTVYGTGKICITSTAAGFYVFPGGYFDEFFETPGTILEFTGDNTATLPLKPGNFYKPYQNVIFSGSGEKRMSADNMRVIGNLTISDGTTLRNTLHNRNIYIQGDWINENTLPGSFLPGTGTVFIEGSTSQQMNVAATERFYNLRMNNPQGLDLSGTAGIEVTRRLTLSQGNIFSYDDRPVSLTNTSPTQAVSGGSESSFVDGPLRKRIISGQAFEFPVGNDGRYGPVRLSAASATPSPAWWTARYVNRNPHDDGYLTGEENLNEPLTTVSANEYWVVDRPAGGSANIRLRWDEDSYPLVTGDGGLRPLLRVVEYEIAPAEWTQRGNAVTGTAESGTVSTTTPVTQPDYIFTLGVIGVTAAIADLTPLSICDNEEIATVPVDLTGTPPWELTYRTTGGTTNDFTETDIMTSPFNIQLRGSEMGGSSGSPYTLSLVSVSDATNPGAVNEATVEIEVKLTNQPEIDGAQAVGVGETRTYSTTENTGNAYAWSWVGDNGGTIQTPGGHQTGITFDQGTGTFTISLVETTTATGCVASDDFTIEVLDVPVPDITPKDANLCAGTTETYSTTYNDGNEYLWTVTGGDCTGCDVWSINASVEVEWSGVGPGSVTVEERVIDTEISATATQNYFIYAEPLPVTLSVDPVCPGSPATVVVEDSQTDITYQLRLHPDNTPVGIPVPGTGGPISLVSDPLPANTVFNVLAFNLGCELESAPITAVVHTAPTLSFTLTGEATICDDEPAEFVLDYTSPTAGFTITITRLRDGDPNEIYNFDQDDPEVTPTPWSWDDFPLWDGVTVPPNNIYTYSAVIVDENTCESLPVIPVEVSVWKRPETGPQYHIPNTHGQ